MSLYEVYRQVGMWYYRESESLRGWPISMETGPFLTRRGAIRALRREHLRKRQKALSIERIEP